MNKIKVGFFSFVEVTDPGAHHSYNEWHQLDHLPEQYPIPGIAFGQRWVATPACQAARAAVTDELRPVHYMALYLMTEPVQPTLDEFLELGHRLGELGRFHLQRRSHLFGAWHLLEAHACPRVLISAEAVPYRPCRGVYAIVEEPTGPLDEWVQRNHRQVSALDDVPGVVGAWSFASSPLYRDDRWNTGSTRVTVMWLDDDPVTVAGALAPWLEDRWDGAPVRPLLAGPMETITPWEWTWFDR
jgi:hypothetical protein